MSRDPPLQFVLDTNVVLDWLVFADPSVQRLREALEVGRIIIVTHEILIDELRRVLSYRRFKLADAAQEELLESYRKSTRANLLSAATLVGRTALPGGFPRCRDRDDEVFVSLAYHTRADALISRDKAVLALTGRLRRFGVTILDLKQLELTLRF